MWQLSANTSPAKITLNKLEGILYDLRLNLLNQSIALPAQNHSQTKIVIVDIDEKSIAEQGRFPWDRKTLAILVDKLAAANTAVVAFDIMFSETQHNPVEEILYSLYLSPQTKQQLVQIRSKFDADLIFANSLAKTDSVLAMQLDDSGMRQPQHIVQHDNLQTSVVLTPANVTAQQTSVLSKSTMRAAIDKLKIQYETDSFRFNQGFINSIPDDDGSIRRAALLLRHKDNIYPSLALEAVRTYSFENQIKVESKPAGDYAFITGLWLNQSFVPTDAYGRIWIPYQGKQASFRYISATDVINDRVDPENLAGAIAFVGTSAAGLADLIETPVGMQYPGVEVHANIAYGLLHPEILLTEPDSVDAIITLFLLLVGLLLSLFLNRLNSIAMILVATVTIAACIGLNLLLWHYWRLVLPLTGCLLLIFGISLINLISGYLAESFQKNKIKNYFEQYVPAAHIDKMLASPNKVSFAGERKQMTVLFADIRDFTRISEGLSAGEVKQLLNEYLSPITKIILDNQGTIDKYVGDMVMAFWGAPLNDPKHCQHAIDAAFEMIEATRKINAEFAKKGWPKIEIGIGINTGEMNVGDMGSEFRRAYTVIGDSVNLASRLESLTKFYGVNFLVSQKTKQTATEFKYLLIDKVKVKGKQQAISVYQPIKFLDEQVMHLHELAYRAYFAQDWENARLLFTSLFEQTQYKVYQIFLARIDVLSQQNLDVWDGSYSHQDK
ncbi:CHASE2 domain-containing protein [Catenovulum sp. 2E275]|uniref:CHASE2 domain-containing protein n=1 Tax=Catenovulum sp. 2E275 TaxID=2980497 RepID=UPI0021D18477|nr:adenylate/guanylate cyclase domain-containing protein [Catenovulum sp. 2E275]